MNGKRHSFVLLTIAALAALCSFRASGVWAAGLPSVFELSDDVQTRGDWLGRYGAYAYVLCGMRAPHSLYGGQGWPIDFSLETGSPDEMARAWLSSAPTENDRSVLWEPNGLRRTAGSFDDHGEVYPLGTGPDLHLHVGIPKGAFVLSLYFFEIDWIQYRAYRIRVLDDATQAELLTSSVSDFFRGKYKRFAVLCAEPADLRIVIERGRSPNAELSAVFLDELKVPDMYLFDRTAEGILPDFTVWSTGESEQQAALALAELIEDPADATGVANYAQSERRVFDAAGSLLDASPQEYGRTFEAFWRRAAGRADQALAAVPDGGPELRLLRYFAARACYDHASARRLAEGLADALRRQGRGGRSPWGAERRLLREYTTVLLEEGRRAEAEPFLAAYVDLCLEQEDADTSRDSLLAAARQALRAGVPLPAADGLTRWQAAHEPLDVNDRLLLAALYYVGGRNSQAVRVLAEVESQVGGDRRRRWCMVAMVTCLLRLDRLDEAKTVMDRLRTTYPGQAEIDEAEYRFGVHYFEKRELLKAQEQFEGLLRSTKSNAYRDLCSQYLDRVSLYQARARGEGPDDDA